mgnify:CR=1 FL=1
MIKEVKGFKPYQHQKAIIDLVDKHPQGATIVVKSSRQKGKSLTINQLVLRNALEFKGVNPTIIEPTNSGCRRQMKDLAKMIEGLPFVKSINFQYQDIELDNGSVIQFRSGESKDSLRGISLKRNALLCIDEASFISDEVFGIILPFCNVYNNTKLLVSTPKFKSGAYYQHYKLALNQQSNHYLVDFKDFDTSMLISEEQLEEAKKTTSYNIFLNEYLGEFLEERGNVFGEFGHIISNNVDLLDRTFYVGIDWSQNKEKDNTAISIFNSQKQQVKLVYFNDKNAIETINIIIDLITEYNPIKITVESNSMGKTMYDLLVNELRKRKITTKVQLFNTTNDSKRRIIENMTLLIERGATQLLDDTEQKLELATYEIQSTKSGKSITYNAKSGNKDDIIIADAIALDSINNTKTYIIR